MPTEDTGVIITRVDLTVIPGGRLTCLLPAVAVMFTVFLKLCIVSFGLKKFNNARELNKSSQCISSLLTLQVQDYTMACHVPTYFQADPALPRASSMASSSIGIFHEVIKPREHFLCDDCEVLHFSSKPWERDNQSPPGQRRKHSTLSGSAWALCVGKIKPRA